MSATDDTTLDASIPAPVQAQDFYAPQPTRLKEIRRTVPAGGPSEVNFPADFVVVKELAAPLWLSFDDEAPVEVGPGFRFKGRKWDRITLRNETAEPVSVVLVCGLGECDRGRQLGIGRAVGAITTQNLVPAGTATAGSAVQLDAADGLQNGAVQVSGVYTGALSLQATVDGANWVTVGGGIAFFNPATAANSDTIASASNGIWLIDLAGFRSVRVTGLAAMTGTATVTLRAS